LMALRQGSLVRSMSLSTSWFLCRQRLILQRWGKPSRWAEGLGLCKLERIAGYRQCFLFQPSDSTTRASHMHLATCRTQHPGVFQRALILARDTSVLELVWSLSVCLSHSHLRSQRRRRRSSRDVTRLSEWNQVGCCANPRIQHNCVPLASSNGGWLCLISCEREQSVLIETH
jgi:hypothetical protein